MGSTWKLRWTGPAAMRQSVSLGDVALMLLMWDALCRQTHQEELEQGEPVDADMADLEVHRANRKMPKSWAKLMEGALGQPGAGLLAELPTGAQGGPFELQLRFPGSDLNLTAAVRRMGGVVQSDVISFDLSKLRRLVADFPKHAGSGSAIPLPL